MTDDVETVLDSIIPAEAFDKTLALCQTLSGECILRIGTDGIDVSLVDPSNVAMHYLDVSPDAFESIPEGSYAIGVDIERTRDYLSKASADDLIRLGFKPSTRRLNVQYRSVDVDIAALDPDTIRTEPDPPALDLPNEFVVERSDLKDAIDLIGFVSDNVEFVCKPDEERVVLRADGDTDTVDVSFGHDEVVDAKVTGETVSLISHDYLDDVLAEIPNTEIEIRAGDEVPLRMFYEFADGNATAETSIAPRIRKR